MTKPTEAPVVDEVVPEQLEHTDSFDEVPDSDSLTPDFDAEETDEVEEIVEELEEDK